MHINTFKNKFSATKHWLEFLRTPSAKSQLIKHIRIQERESRLQEAIFALNAYLKDCNLPLYGAEKDKIQKLDQSFEVEKRILSIMDKQDTFGNLVRDAYPELRKNIEEKTVLKDSDQETHQLKTQIKQQESAFSPASVIVDGDKRLQCFFCPECLPTPADQIIAKSTALGLKIHAMRCKALKTISYDALMEAHWEEQGIALYHFSLKLKYLPRELSVMDFIQLFAQFKVSLVEMSIKHTDTGYAIVSFLLELDNPAKIAFILKELKKYHNSLTVLQKVIQ